MRHSLSLLSLALFTSACSGSESDDFYELDAQVTRDAAVDRGQHAPPRDAGDERETMDASAADASSQTDASDVLDATIQDASIPVSTAVILDFEESALPAQIDPGMGTLTPSQGFAPYGSAGNTFGPTFL